MSKVRVSVPSTSKMTSTRLTQECYGRAGHLSQTRSMVHGGVSTTVEIGWASGADPRAGSPADHRQTRRERQNPSPCSQHSASGSWASRRSDRTASGSPRSQTLLASSTLPHHGRGDEDRRARVHHRWGEAVLLRRGVEAMPSQPRRRERSSKTRAWCCVLDAPSSVLEQLEMLLVALAPIADPCHHGSDHAIAARTSKLERLPHRSPYSRIDVVTEQRPSAVQASLRCLLVDLQAGGGLGSG